MHSNECKYKFSWILISFQRQNTTLEIISVYVLLRRLLMFYSKDEDVQKKVATIERFSLLTLGNIKACSEMLGTMKKHDEYLYQHAYNVARLSTIIGVEYSFNLHELQNIYIGGILHDIGKIYLNQEILYKPDFLNNDERIFIEAHTNLGYKALKPLGLDPLVLNIVKSHHEKLNGNGYPDMLSVDEIPIFVQIVTVADIYDALSNKRSYRAALSREKIFKIMENDDGLNQMAVSLIKEVAEKE